MALLLVLHPLNLTSTLRTDGGKIDDERSMRSARHLLELNTVLVPTEYSLTLDRAAARHRDWAESHYS